MSYQQAIKLKDEVWKTLRIRATMHCIDGLWFVYTGDGMLCEPA